MRDIQISLREQRPVFRQPVEFVERKGLGHPDSICDAIMEAVSVALCREYLRTAGRVLHHNIDKGLLVAGQTTPSLGGGRVETPMRIIFGDRATSEINHHKIPLDDIVEATTGQWIKENLRFVDPQQHVVLQNEIQHGSPELTDIFARERLVANDTSAAVGYAPLTETEQLVLEAERLINSRKFKQEFPEAGEDVKVMGIRHDRKIFLTVAIAFVDRFVPDQKTYFDRKTIISEKIQQHLTSQLKEVDEIELDVNTLDDPNRGLGGMYLTVLGTSAEGGDGGQVGRGNRVNGVISLYRPMGTEAAAGKNPVSHVGKIYNLLSNQIANRIYESIDAVEEVNVWLCSQIGRPIGDPWSTAVDVNLVSGVSLGEVETSISEIIQSELDTIESFTARLSQGEFPVC